MGGCCSSENQDNINSNNDSSNNKTSSNNKNEEILCILKDIPLLSNLKEKAQEEISTKLTEKEFKKGENLMSQGDLGHEFFIIVSGECKVIVSDESGEKTEIAILRKGDYCGEQALMNDAKRGATVQAAVDTMTLVLNQTSFKQIMKDNNIRFAKREAKREAVSAELMENLKVQEHSSQSLEKSKEKIEWLLNCVKDNVLFNHLDEKQREIVVNQMHKEECKLDDILIKQGDVGDSFYVVEEGNFVVTIEDIGVVTKYKNSECFGELALLYNAPRAATVTCKDENGGLVWVVERSAFRKALMDHANETSNKNLEFLKKVELLQPLLSSELQLVDQALEQESFTNGTVVFNLGDEGDKFYIVKEGTCIGNAKDGTNFELGIGSFFGERALLTNEPRAATIKCSSDCIFLTLSREDFSTLLGPLEDIMSRNLDEYDKPQDERKPLGHKLKNDACQLSEFKIIGILGRGAFGTVKLVVDPTTDKSYALKAIRKNQVVELGQQAHILNEKKVMQIMDNPFLVNLRGTYKDTNKVYFLLEVCLGGELFTILRKMRSFDENTAKFYTGCVVEAFDYMHERDIIYRDLKPENLVMSSNGYLKVTDFGFAKVVPNKTFTLCGTPDYLAPEIVTGQGHGKGVDWWTVGILVYEMLASFPPFFDDEPMMTYRKIIQGKFKFPRYLSSQSKDIISKFLKPKATKRLGVIKGGAKLIKKHPWFNGFDWSSLESLQMKPPMKPKVKSPEDLSNFDHFQDRDEDLEYKGDPDLGWDDEF